MTKLQERISNLETKEIKEISIELMDNFEEGSDLVLEVATEELEKRLDEKSFIDFMNSL